LIDVRAALGFGTPSLVMKRFRTTHLLWSAMGAHLLAALVLLPVASHPYDMTVLTGGAEAWLRWGVPPLFGWKFGSDYAALTVASQAGRLFLAWLGVPGIAAIHIAWKLPLVAANLLSSVLLYRLGRRFVPRHAALLAALWLLNPVVLWVAAGHGQVESVAALSMFSAIALALSGRFFLAGVLTGLGIGIEYFPLAVAAAVLVWWLGRLIDFQRFRNYGIGLAMTLALCFGPGLIDPIGRTGLLGGLASSGGFDVNGYPSQSTLWTLLGPQLAHYWPITFVLSALLCTVALLLWKRPSWELGIVVTASLLVLFVLWNPNSLPQFALIAATALYLLAVTVPVNPLLLVGLPIAGQSTYFLFLDGGSSTPNAFFYDDWSHMLPRLWQPPQSSIIAADLGRLFASGLLATFVYSLFSKALAGKGFWVGGLAIGCAASLALCIWASQPVFWIGAFSGPTTADLPDFNWTTRSRTGTMEFLGLNGFGLRFSDSLVTAARRSTIQPRAGFRYTRPEIYARQVAGGSTTAAQWGAQSVVLPNWGQMRNSVGNLWIEILISSPANRQGTSISDIRPTLSINDASFSAADVYPLATWLGLEQTERADFLVSSSIVDRSGAVTIQVEPEWLVWNGSGTDPWMRILPASGTVMAQSSGTVIPLDYQLDTDGQGYLLGLPVRPAQVVTIPEPNLSPGSIGQAVLRWPSDDLSWTRNLATRLTGGLWLLLLAASAALAFRLSSSSMGGSQEGSNVNTLDGESPVAASSLTAN
jgi:hypothetical protein